MSTQRRLDKDPFESGPKVCPPPRKANLKPSYTKAQVRRQRLTLFENHRKNDSFEAWSRQASGGASLRSRNIEGKKSIKSLRTVPKLDAPGCFARSSRLELNSSPITEVIQCIPMTQLRLTCPDDERLECLNFLNG